MTREELVQMREYNVAQASTEYWNKNKDNDEVSIMTAFEDGVAWADAHPQSPWISTEDKLPECKWDERVSKNHSDDCLVLQADGSRYVAQYFCDFEAWSETSDMCEWLHNITHWMPIPKLKKGGEK